MIGEALDGASVTVSHAAWHLVESPVRQHFDVDPVHTTLPNGPLGQHAAANTKQNKTNIIVKKESATTTSRTFGCRIVAVDVRRAASQAVGSIASRRLRRRTTVSARADLIRRAAVVAARVEASAFWTGRLRRADQNATQNDSEKLTALQTTLPVRASGNGAVVDMPATV